MIVLLAARLSPMPGVYPYTVTAADNSTTPAILTAATSTTVSVTVQ